jgi:catechol 2,3-dioxygenase-like lactoylglutathione lyase family enzyme
MTIEVTATFHPTLLVPDLDEARTFFERVFARSTVSLSGNSYVSVIQENSPGAPTEYFFFVSLAEVQLDAHRPDLFVYDGIQHYPSVDRPRLHTTSWYVDGLEELYHALAADDYRILRLHGSDPQATPPVARFSDDRILYFVDEAEVGLEYQVYDPRGGVLDARKKPEWSPSYSVIAPEDPLGLEFCSHHTVLTDQPDRALRFVVDHLKGTVVHQGPSTLLEADSTYVWLGDSIGEFAVPTTEGTPEWAAWKDRAPLDTYYALTFKVPDVEKAAAHLAKEGVKLLHHTDAAIVTDPITSLGVAWGFTTETIAGDPRG